MEYELVNWTIFKQFVDDRKLSVQWIDLGNKYFLKAFDGLFILACRIDKNPSDTSELDDFQDNYKGDGNKPLEERASLKMMKGKKSTTSGVAELLMKIPGQPGSGQGRYIVGGLAWFTTPHEDDKIEVFLTDEDNITGAGAGTVVGSYTESEGLEENKGWFICKHSPFLEISPISGGAFIPAGFYLKIVATKGSGEDDFYCNIKWGKRE